MVYFIALCDIKSSHGKYKISAFLKIRLYFSRCVEQCFKIPPKVFDPHVFLYCAGRACEKEELLINT